LNLKVGDMVQFSTKCWHPMSKNRDWITVFLTAQRVRLEPGTCWSQVQYACASMQIPKRWRYIYIYIYKLTFDGEVGRCGDGASLVLGRCAYRASIVGEHFSDAQRVVEPVGRVDHLEVRRTSFDHLVAVVLPAHPRRRPTAHAHRQAGGVAFRYLQRAERLHERRSFAADTFRACQKNTVTVYNRGSQPRVSAPLGGVWRIIQGVSRLVFGK